MDKLGVSLLLVILVVAVANIVTVLKMLLAFGALVAYFYLFVLVVCGPVAILAGGWQKRRLERAYYRRALAMK